MIRENNIAKRYISTDIFYEQLEKVIMCAEPNQYALVSLDFDNFNFINDLFSYQIGDAVLYLMTKHFENSLKDGEFVAKINADHFIFLINVVESSDIELRFSKMTEIKTILADVLPVNYNIVCSGGIALIDNPQENLSVILDNANFARKQAKGNGKNTFMFYDGKMEEALSWRKVITFSTESALANHEFEMYLQPKILIKTHQIVGAEALARWNSKKFGIILPDRFIPILEQNGYITQLDFYMLKEACLYLQKSIRKNMTPHPISVNFSKLHLRSENFVEDIYKMVSGCGVPTKLIEIEMTENVFSDDFQRLIDIASGLKYLGFRVSLDDFGSAYSSLNYLKELPLDIIKIDKGFLNSSSDSDKGRVIIAKMVELIKSLRMTPIMEGVETEDQVEFLSKLGCDLAQGFFYAKPMPVHEYDEYVKNTLQMKDIEGYFAETTKNNDASFMHEIPQEFQMDNWELYTLGKNIDMGLMKGDLRTLTVQYVNERALEYFGYSRQEFREIFHNSLLAIIHPDDVAMVCTDAVQLIETGEPLVFKARAINKSGKVMMLQGRVSCVIDSEGRAVGIYAFQDVTDELECQATLKSSLESKIKELELMVISEKKSQESLRVSEERYRLVVEQSDDIMFEWDFDKNAIIFSSKYAEVFGEEPISVNVSTNPEISSRIHPSDIGDFKKWATATYRKIGVNEGEFRIKSKRGKYLWVHACSTAACDQCGKPVRAVGVFKNIDKQKNEINTLTIKSQIDPLTQLLNKEETRRRIENMIKEYPKAKGAFIIVDIDNFKGVNDNLGHQFGDAVLKEVSSKFMHMFGSGEVVGRLGGDEIVVFLNNVNSRAEVQSKMDKLFQALRGTYFGDTSKYEISVSAGIALYPSDGKNFNELYRFSDIALYVSKREGKDCYTFYSKDIEAPLLNAKTPMEWSERFLSHYFEGDFIYNVFELLYETKDMAITMQMILELAGKRFHVDRVYIFENSTDSNFTSNTYEWCAPGIVSEKDNLQNISTEDLKYFLSSFSDEGIFCCSDVATMDPLSFEILTKQGIKSLLHCAISDEGRMSGFIGFDICHEYREWHGDEIAVLGYLSRVVSMFLLKKQKMREIMESHRNYVEMIDNFNGFVYVINKKTYEILYMNDVSRKAGLKIGEKCYCGAFHADAPCKNCPVVVLTKDNPHATEEIFSELLGKWVSSAASSLKWAGEIDAALVCCTDISKYKK